MEGEKRNGLKKPQTRRHPSIHPDESPLGRLNQTASGSRYGGSSNRGSSLYDVHALSDVSAPQLLPRSPRRSILKLHTSISIRLDLNQIEVITPVHAAIRQGMRG